MKYEKIIYPDGQISVKFHSTIGDIDRFVIHERINSYEDLFYVKSICDALRNIFPKIDISLKIPCLFGQRSDRRFSGIQSFDLKIICDFINSCNFSNIEILDPHSDVAIALLSNCHKSVIDYIIPSILNLITEKDIVFVSPDAGAYKKVFEIGKSCNKEIVAAVKYRDSTGKIDLRFIGNVKDRECIIIDDICDGGATFVALGYALKQQGASKVYLYVTHGYFSKGYMALSQHIDHIFCTNSVKDLDPVIIDDKDYVTQFKVI